MKPHVSASSLNMLAKCPSQFEHRYVRGIKSPPGVSMIIGGGVHSSAEADLVNKMEWGELLPDEAIPDLAADATRAKWAREEPMVTENDPDQGGAVDEAVALAKAHHAKVAPGIEPIAIERGFRLVTEVSHDIVGYVDLETTTHIRDLKTKARAPSGQPARDSIQGELYTLETKVRTGVNKPFALDHLIRGKVIRHIPVEAIFSDDEHVGFLRRVEESIGMIAAGRFPPTAKDSWTCCARWCGYYESHCPWGARKAVSVGLIDPTRLTSKVERRP